MKRTHEPENECGYTQPHHTDLWHTVLSFCSIVQSAALSLVCRLWYSTLPRVHTVQIGNWCDSQVRLIEQDEHEHTHLLSLLEEEHWIRSVWEGVYCSHTMICAVLNALNLTHLMTFSLYKALRIRQLSLAKLSKCKIVSSYNVVNVYLYVCRNQVITVYPLALFKHLLHRKRGVGKIIASTPVHNVQFMFPIRDCHTVAEMVSYNDVQLERKQPVKLTSLKTATHKERGFIDYVDGGLSSLVEQLRHLRLLNIAVLNSENIVEQALNKTNV